MTIAAPFDAIITATAARVDAVLSTVIYGDPLFALRATIDEAAAAARALRRGRSLPRVACKAGCSTCCEHQSPLVSVPEAIALAHHMLWAFDGNLDAAAESLDLRAAPDGCILLAGRMCSVYAARPIVCRAYLSFSLSDCRKRALTPSYQIRGDAITQAAMHAAWLGMIGAFGAWGIDADLVPLRPALELLLGPDGISGITAAWLRGDWPDDAIIDAPTAKARIEPSHAEGVRLGFDVARARLP